MLAETIIAANIAEQKIEQVAQVVKVVVQSDVERAAYWGWEDATLGESMRGSEYYLVDSPLWWVYVGAYKRTKAELGEDLDGCEFELLPEWQREDWVGE